MDVTQESIGWETYLIAGTKALSIGRYDDAEKLFQKALMEARKELTEPAAATSAAGQADASKDSPPAAEAGLAKISENMGELYRLQGQFKESESFFKQALDLNEKVHGGRIGQTRGRLPGPG